MGDSGKKSLLSYDNDDDGHFVRRSSPRLKKRRKELLPILGEQESHCHASEDEHQASLEPGNDQVMKAARILKDTDQSPERVLSATTAAFSPASDTVSPRASLRRCHGGLSVGILLIVGIYTVGPTTANPVEIILCRVKPLRRQRSALETVKLCRLLRAKKDTFPKIL